MTISLWEFLRELFTIPTLLVTSILTFSVILVNGWTDAPNAIATCVSTRSMTPRAAVIMATIFNFLGVLVMTMINNSVALTVFNMVDFRGDTHTALAALCAALFAIVAWATAAWWFGIPTSESHALIAGLSGAAIALQGGFSGINGSEWVKVIYGLVLSTFMGFGMGFAVVKGVELVCYRIDRRKTLGFSKMLRLLPLLRWVLCTAHRTGKIHERIYAWDFPCKRAGTNGWFYYSILADRSLLGRYGAGYLDWRVQNNKGSGYGYGETGKIPGFFSRSCRSDLSACVFINRSAG